MTPEHERLEEARTGAVAWKAWGPYLSERQWGTVREDDSAGGDAWNAFTHDEARSKAYRWGEDGLAGVSDDQQRLCLALALWNGADPILKERIFGLTNSEGNHGEDAKEYWFYLDSTPTHSYMKWAYKYPQAAFPYEQLVNHGRGRGEPELDLLETGVFDEDRYFDVVVEYAKGGAEDLLMLITVHNRGPEAATLHVLPTLWFRNTWRDGSEKPALTLDGDAVVADAFRFSADGEWLFCENESEGPYPKVTLNDHVLHGAPTNPAQTGTKCAAHSVLEVPAGGTAILRARLSTGEHGDFADVFATRRAEADTFYREVIPAGLGEDRTRIMRQALAGMLWTKQFYEYDVHRWLRERGLSPWSPEAAQVRNGTWFHLQAGDIISMPDKWEYPWFAAWDLAFHCAPLSLVDVDFAKEQVELLLHTRYVHPNGQIPAYEWNFSDVNPPVTAWSAMWVYRREAELRGTGDRVWLGRVFQRLLTNFTWWVNRKDPDGRNLFQGGFLGLDNIGVFDRSARASGRRDAAPGRRHGVDGALLPVDAADRGRARPRGPVLRRHRAQVRRALRVDRDRAQSPGRGHAAVGRAGRVLLRRDADAGRGDDPAARAVAGRAAADVRGDGVRSRGPGGAAGPGGTGARVRGALPGLRARAHARAARRPRGAPDALARHRGSAAPDPEGDARRGRVPRRRTASARSPSATSSSRTGSTGPVSATRSATSRPSPTAACSAATRTGAGRCGSR